MEKKILEKILFICFAAVIAWFLMVGIDLTSEDMGRHLENGKQILSYGLVGNPVLNTNFYSYTNPLYPTFNHHWLSGILMYLTVNFGSFEILQLIYILLIILAFGIVWNISKTKFGLWPTVISVAILFPLYAYRKEVRPEVFSIILFWTLFFVWEKVNSHKIGYNWLYLTPLVMIFWVNLHIYFFLGFGVIAAFLIQNFYSSKKAYSNKTSLIILLLSFAGIFVNPLGIGAVLYPFNIFQHYGYRVLENQTVWFLFNYGLSSPEFKLFSWVLVASIILLLVVVVKRTFPLSWWILCLGSVFTACFAVRNISFFAFSTTLVLAWGFKNSSLFLKKYFGREWNSVRAVLTMFLLIVAIGLNFYQQTAFIKYLLSNAGLGVGDETYKLQTFLRDNIKGPIFNNYDSGGFLIYTYYPKEKVFVDNRPESYPESFFNQVYIPMQENNNDWQKELSKWNFNSIIFTWHDLTPWAQEFMINRLNDPMWVPVYVNSKVLVFIKNTEDNLEVIKKYELPKDIFKHG